MRDFDAKAKELAFVWDLTAEEKDEFIALLRSVALEEAEWWDGYVHELNDGDWDLIGGEQRLAELRRQV